MFKCKKCCNISKHHAKNLCHGCYDKQQYIKNKDKILKRRKEHRYNNKDKISQINKDYYKNHRDKVIKCTRKYYESNKDKYIMKVSKRRRKLNWNKLIPNPFPSDVEVHWHYIDDTYVVAIPKELHMSYYGSNHRDRLLPIIQKLYFGV